MSLGPRGALDHQTPTCGLNGALAAELTLPGLPGSPPLSTHLAPSPSLPSSFPKFSPRCFTNTLDTFPPLSLHFPISCHGLFRYLCQCPRAQFKSHPLFGRSEHLWSEPHGSALKHTSPHSRGCLLYFSLRPHWTPGSPSGGLGMHGCLSRGSCLPLPQPGFSEHLLID